jgi:hypothetical protein
MAAQLAAALAEAAAPPSLVPSPLSELPDGLLLACLAPLAAADRAASACTCTRWARLLRHAPSWRAVSFYTPLSRGGATWVSDTALAGAFAAALAAGGAMSVDLRSTLGVSPPAALQAACAAHACTLRRVLLADTDSVCRHRGHVLASSRAGNQQFWDAAQLAQLAAALPACVELTANLHVDASSEEALAALVRLSEARCVRLGRVRSARPRYNIRPARPWRRSAAAVLHAARGARGGAGRAAARFGRGRHAARRDLPAR